MSKKNWDVAGRDRATDNDYNDAYEEYVSGERDSEERRREAQKDKERRQKRKGRDKF